MERESLPESEKVFFDRMTPVAREVAGRLGVLPSVYFAAGEPTPTPQPDTTISSGRADLTTDEDRHAWDQMSELQRRVATTMGVKPAAFMRERGDQP